MLFRNRKPTGSPSTSSSLTPATRVAVMYALFGVLWILGSDQLLLALVTNPRVLTSLQTIKGWLFVGASAVLLFWAIRREFVKRIEQHDRLASVRRELRLARTIQQSFLPRIFPPFPDREEFDVFAEAVPAREVGGDFYDFFLVAPDRLGVVIGDVSGKGIPAAILMAAARTMLKAAAIQDLPPNRCLSYVNNLLREEAPAGMFVSAFYAVVNLRSGEVIFSNAGHEPPFVIRGGRGATPQSVPIESALVLGIQADTPYTTGTLTLFPGDTLFLYTDGVTDALNGEDTMYSTERLAETLKAVADLPPQDMIKAVVENLHRLTDGASQVDDMTMLALRYHGGTQAGQT